MNYRVLIGTPSAELEAGLVARFNELIDVEVVDAHRSSAELAEAVAEIPELDVVLVHQQIGPIPVFDTVRGLSQRHPQLAILVVSPTMDPETFTNAMEAGARGVVSQDIGLDELRNRVSGAGDWSRTLRRHLEAAQLHLPVTSGQGRIITLSGAKGGVGTTTSAVHLAITAAKNGRVVCLVDLDLQTGDVPSFLDLKHRRSITDLIESGDDISAAMLSEALYVHPHGLHVLLAPEHGERGEDVSARAARKVLGALRSRYELVVVDCGSTMNEATAMAVELADTSVVTCTPDLPALRAAQRLMTMWERLQIREKAKVFSLLTRHSRKNEIQPEFAHKLLGTQVLKTPVPAAYRALEKAENTGDPLQVSDEGIRRSYTRLAAELEMLGDPGAGQNTDGPATRDMSGFIMGGSGDTPASGSARDHGDRGGGLVEFAVVVPFLLLALLLVWQVVLLGISAMYASHAAAEGARQAAVTPRDMDRIDEEARKRIRPPWNEEDTFSVRVDRREDGSYVQAVVMMPVVLPGTPSAWEIVGEAKVVPEGDTGLP